MFHIKDCILYGYDLYGGDIRVQTANSYRECNRKCRTTPLCEGWTFESSKNRDCYLKEEAGDEVVFCSDCKTGFRNYKDVECGIKGVIIITTIFALAGIISSPHDK